MAENNKVQIDIVARDMASQALKSVETGAAGLSNHVSQLTGMVGGLSGAFGGITAVLAGGALFKDVISGTKEVVGEVVKLSKSFGISSQEASYLRIALDDAFLTVDDMSGGLNRITKQLGNNEAAFKALNVETRDSNGNYRNSVDIMMDVNSALTKIKEGTDRNVAGMSIYGKGWAEARNLLKLNAEGLQEAKARAEELHLVVGNEGVAQVKKYKMAMKDIDDVAESLKYQLGSQLLPILTKVAVAFGDIGTKSVKTLGDNMPQIEGMFLQMTMFADKAAAAAYRVAAAFSFGSGTGLGQHFIDQANWMEGRYSAANVRNQELFWARDSVDPQMARLNYDKNNRGGAGNNYSGDNAGAELEKQYNEKWNTLQDKINLMNPALTEYQKKIREVNQEYDSLILQYPKHTAELNHNRDVMLSWVKAAEEYKNEIIYNQSKSAVGTYIDQTIVENRIAEYKADSAETERQTQLQIAAAGIIEQTENAMHLRRLERSGDIVASMQAKHAIEMQQLDINYQDELFKAAENEESKYLIEEKYRLQKRASEELLQADIEAVRETWRQNGIRAYEAGEQTKQSMAMETAGNAIALMNMLGQKNKGFAIAALVASKGLAMAQTFINFKVAEAQTLAQMGYIVGMPLVAQLEAMMWTNMGLIAATGISQFAMGGGGGGAPQGTAANPTVTQPGGVNTQQQGSVTININGSIIGEDAWVENNLIPAIRNAGSRNITINN